jgi:OOP family OmpA-OmpF porin
MRASIVVAATLAGLVGVAAVARAQDKTEDQYLRDLKPTTLTGATKGIRPGATSAPAAGAAGYAAAAHPSSTVDVQFATGSAELSATATRKLDQLGRALSDQALAAYRFRVEGHTDTVGTEDFNQALSERRARAVANYLREKFAIPAERLQAVGFGSHGQAVPTGDQVAEPRNRRVQVVNLDA